MKTDLNNISIDLLPINVAILRINTNGEFILVNVNTMLQETERISKEALIGQSVTKAFTGLEKMGLIEMFKRVLESGVSEVLNVAYYQDERKSGWRKNKISRLDEETIIALYEDVSLLKELEGEVAEKINELENLTNKFEDKALDLQKAQKLGKIGSWKYDIVEDILIWSDETYNIFQIDKIKNPVSTLNDFFTKVDPTYIEVVNREYTQHLKSAIPYEVTHELLLEDGTSKWIKERCETIYDTGNNPIESNGILEDITEDVENKNNIRKKEAQLLQQSGLAQMGEMISMIAHQWRQPLSIITLKISNLQFKQLFGKKVPQSEIDNVFTFINDTIIYLSETIDDFRNFYKPDKESLNVNLEEVISKALNVIKPSLLNEKIKIIQEYHSNEEIELYDNEVMQVVLSILKNSQDNFKDKNLKNQQITITTRDRTITICDNGKGIKESIIDKIFDPYFSTKNEKNGTGLGLYMAKTIIEEHHNGKFTVKNTSDGVCFRIEFGVILKG
ncbi:MAG: signal transduction histidine kinase [Sulfurimonas sp.]|jgi:signal transduction histidine kinase|uniref:sensor histidine kinase n=1 Tax=Sulfurimonas sp. TaxID=2022749 RepID=UPI0039E64B28